MKLNAALMGSVFVILASFATGCSDPCGDLADCCKAQLANVPAEQKAAAEAVCNGYEEADSDACQTVIDNYKAPEGADVPEECKF